MYIEAVLERSGATLIADYDAEQRRMVLRSIRDGIDICAAVRLYCHQRGVYPTIMDEYSPLTRTQEILLAETILHKPGTAESDYPLIESLAEPYLPQITMSAGNLNGMTNGKPVHLRFFESFNEPAFYEDIVVQLTIGVAPYRI